MKLSSFLEEQEQLHSRHYLSSLRSESPFVDLISFFILRAEQLMNKERWMSFIIWILLYLVNIQFGIKERYVYPYQDYQKKHTSLSRLYLFCIQYPKIFIYAFFDREYKSNCNTISTNFIVSSLLIVSSGQRDT